MLKPELLPRLKQPVDMGWVNHPKVWYVGDADALVCCGNTKVYIEIKKHGRPANKWQDKMYHEEVDGQLAIGKRAFYLRCEHYVENIEDPVVLMDCIVAHQYDIEGVSYTGMRVEEALTDILKGEI